ncbi:MAG: ATP-binding cassette domain-containing protein, partial [Tissierellia bacterium]|nr:ATP-binding cassette domain-containing protein [Tissierellia bacterium]
LYYLKEIIDKFYYMKNGRIIDCKTNQEFFENEAENKSKGLRSLKLENIVPTGERIIGSNRLEIKELSFSYRETKIFQNINYSFSSGNIYGIAGNNGVGKSTLGKILSGILDCKSGKVIYNKKPLSKNKRRKQIYYLSNNPDSNLFGVSAQEELELNCKNCDVEAILENYNLAEFKNTHPQILSGGQKQRLTIAQSELLDRDVYILDEPTSGLDAKNMEIIANRIKEFQAKDKIILIISHDYELLMKICTDICWLNRDNILSLDPKTQRDLILKLLMKGESV